MSEVKRHQVREAPNGRRVRVLETGNGATRLVEAEGQWKGSKYMAVTDTVEAWPVVTNEELVKDAV